jgi:hypothetical protein
VRVLEPEGNRPPSRDHDHGYLVPVILTLFTLPTLHLARRRPGSPFRPSLSPSSPSSSIAGHVCVQMHDRRREHAGNASGQPVQSFGVEISTARTSAHQREAIDLRAVSCAPSCYVALQPGVSKSGPTFQKRREGSCGRIGVADPNGDVCACRYALADCTC